MVSSEVSLIKDTKEVIVWGSNMSSGIGTGRISRQLAEMYQFTSYQYSVIIGLILSDGWIIFSKGSTNPRLGFKQSLEKFSYFFHVFNILAPFCMSMPSLTVGKRNLTTTYALNFFTRSLPCLKSLHSMFYSKTSKSVPEDIFNLLDPISLAHLIMGDGGVRPVGLVLCTDSFTLQDVVRLMNVLMIRYDLQCNLRTVKFTNSTQGHRIYIRQASMVKLQNIVKIHMIKSM